MCSGIKSCMMELLEFILQFRVPISKKLRISALLLLSKDKIVGTVSLKIASFFKKILFHLLIFWQTLNTSLGHGINGHI